MDKEKEAILELLIENEATAKEIKGRLQTGKQLDSLVYLGQEYGSRLEMIVYLARVISEKNSC